MGASRGHFFRDNPSLMWKLVHLTSRRVKAVGVVNKLVHQSGINYKLRDKWIAEQAVNGDVGYGQGFLWLSPGNNTPETSPGCSAKSYNHLVLNCDIWKIGLVKRFQAGGEPLVVTWVRWLHGTSKQSFLLLCKFTTT